MATGFLELALLAQHFVLPPQLLLFGLIRFESSVAGK